MAPENEGARAATAGGSASAGDGKGRSRQPRRDPADLARIRELEARVTELEAELPAREAALERSYRARRKELEAAAKADEAKRSEAMDALERELAGKREQVERDLAARREEVERELAGYREETRREVEGRLGDFSQNYDYYLQQLKLMMDLLTESSIEVGKSFLVPGADATGDLFKRQMGDFIEPETDHGLDGDESPGLAGTSAAKRLSDVAAGAEIEVESPSHVDGWGREAAERPSGSDGSQMAGTPEDGTPSSGDGFARSMEAESEAPARMAAMVVSDAERSAHITESTPSQEKSIPINAIRRPISTRERVANARSVVFTILFALVFVLLAWTIWLMLTEELAFMDALRAIGGTIGGWFGGVS